MNKEEKSIIEEMSPSDFLSFLYLEREREDSLNKKYGWTNYALCGACIGVICLLYTIIDESIIQWRNVVVYLSGMCSFLLFLFFFGRVLSRRRLVDSNKVKFLKEVFPWGYFLISCIITISLFVCSTFVYDLEQIKWLWTLLLLILIFTGVVSYFSRDEVVPTYFRDSYFPCHNANLLYSAVVGGLFGLISYISINMMRWEVFSYSFQVAVLISSLAFLIYLLLHINLQNQNVGILDNLIDCYIYGYLTQEDVYRQLRRRYFGYGVIEACYADLKRIEIYAKSCEEKQPFLDTMKHKLVTEDCSLCDFSQQMNELKSILSLVDDALKASRNLINRIRKIKSIIGEDRFSAELDFLYRKNEKLYNRIEHIHSDIKAINEIIRRSIHALYVRND